VAFQGFCVTITGKSEFPNAEILITTYTDYFTYRNQIIAQTTANQKGEFELTFDLDNTQEIFIKIEDVTAGLFAVSNGKYQVEFPAYQGVEENILSKTKFVNLKIIDEPEPQLN